MITTDYKPVKYAGDGIQKQFNVTFKFPRVGDIKCTLKDSMGNITDLTYNSDYTITNVNPTGPTYARVNTSIAPASETEVFVYAESLFRQESQYKNTGDFNLPVVEKNLDDITLYLQQLADELSRAVKLGITSDKNPETIISDIEKQAAEVATDAQKVAQAISQMFVQSTPHDLKTVAGQLDYHVDFPISKEEYNVQVFLGGIKQTKITAFTIEDGDIIRFTSDPGVQPLTVESSLSYANPDLSTAINSYLVVAEQDLENYSNSTVKPELNVIMSYIALEWKNGEDVTNPNQLYVFNADTTSPAYHRRFFAPNASTQSPVAMGATPISDTNFVELIDYYSPDQAGGITNYRNYLSSLGFWKNDANTPEIRRNSGRLFVGDACENSGTKEPSSDSVDGRSWLGKEASGNMTYFDSRSLIEAISPNGAVAIAAASRSSDNTRAGERNTIGVASYVKNDNVTPGEEKTVWAIYGHAHNASQESMFTTCMELATANSQNTVECNPYSMGTKGTTAVIWMQNGGETAEGGETTNPLSVAIGITGGASGQSGARFKRGIIFEHDALVGTDGTGTGVAAAIAMAMGHRTEWRFSGGENAVGASHTSYCDDINSATHIIHRNNGLNVEDNAGNTILRLNPNFGWIPGRDGVYNIGTSSFRINNYYGVNGAIVTSDRNKKALEQNIPDDVLDAWSQVEYKKFKMKSAIDEKGDGARWHIGVIAQDIEIVFRENGLDAFEYGILCLDDGKYSVRYDEISCLENALQRRELKKIKDKLGMK